MRKLVAGEQHLIAETHAGRRQIAAAASRTTAPAASVARQELTGGGIRRARRRFRPAGAQRAVDYAASGSSTNAAASFARLRDGIAKAATEPARTSAAPIQSAGVMPCTKDVPDE